MYNTATWAAADRETTLFPLPFQEIGASAKEKFVSKCVKDPANFKKPIKKQKAITFATQLKKYKIKGDEKGEITTMIRGLFVNLYKKKKVDMAEVLRYPLTPLPLSLCHTDSRMQSTPKSALLNEIEARVACVLPEYIDVIIVDGVFFFYIYSLIYWAQWVKQLQ